MRTESHRPVDVKALTHESAVNLGARQMLDHLKASGEFSHQERVRIEGVGKQYFREKGLCDGQSR